MNPLSYALVAQLDRALDSDSKGRWFESSQARHPRSLDIPHFFGVIGAFVILHKPLFF